MDTTETKARDIMSAEILSIRETTTMEEAIRLMVNSRITGLPVVDKQGRMVGVYSEYDALKQAGKSKALKPEIFQQPVQFSEKVEAITESTPLPKIIKLFIDSKFRRLPVISDSGKLVGIITRRDLMRLFYYRAKLG